MAPAPTDVLRPLSAARLGDHEIEVLVGPDLIRSYGGPYPVLYLTAEGRFAGSSRLASIGFGSRFGG